METLQQDIYIVVNLKSDHNQLTFNICPDKSLLTGMGRCWSTVSPNGSNGVTCRKCGDQMQVNIYLNPNNFVTIPAEELEKAKVQRKKSTTKPIEPNIIPASSTLAMKSDPEDVEMHLGKVKQEVSTVDEPDMDADVKEERDDCSDISIGEYMTQKMIEPEPSHSKNPPNSEMSKERPPEKQIRRRRRTKKIPVVDPNKQVKNHKADENADEFMKDTELEIKIDRILTTPQEFDDAYEEWSTKLDRLYPYQKLVTLGDGFKLYLTKSRNNSLYMTTFNPRAFNCDMCTIRKNDPLSLIIHRSSHFYNKDILRCYGCKAQYTSKDSIMRHVCYCRYNTKEPPLVCIECGKQFQTIVSLKFHEKQHVPDLSVNRTHLCEICSKWFPSKDCVNRHIKQKHHIGSVECHHCGKNFGQKSLILLHLVRSHFPNLTPFKCTVCGQVFTKAYALENHVAVVHKKTTASECPVCKKVLQSNSLKVHMEMHRAAHERTKFFCDVCGKLFFTIGNKEKHMTIVHSDPETWKFQCPQCDRKYPMKMIMMQHIKEKHTDRVVCTICGKDFATKQYLKDHYNIHTVSGTLGQVPGYLKTYLVNSRQRKR